jgi:hypothetical protein
VNFYQNLTGWQPPTAVDGTSMSNTKEMGAVFRTYNPTQQWLVALTALAMTRLFFERVTFGRVILFDIMLLFLALTFFRSLYLGFAVALAFVIWVSVRRRAAVRKLRLGKVVALLAVLALLVYGTLTLFPSVNDRLQSTFYEITTEGGTFAHRIKLLAYSLLITDNYFLGGGFGQLQFQNALASPLEFLIASLDAGADSGLVNLFFRFGLIGLALFGVITIVFLRRSYERLKRMQPCREYSLIVAACAYTIWVWVTGVANNTFTSIANGTVLASFWAVSDIAWGLYSQRAGSGKPGAAQGEELAA